MKNIEVSHAPRDARALWAEKENFFGELMQIEPKMTLNACHSRNHLQNVHIHVFNTSLHEPNHEMTLNTNLNESCREKVKTAQ